MDERDVRTTAPEAPPPEDLTRKGRQVKKPRSSHKRPSGGSFCAVGGCANRSHRDKTSRIPGRSFIRYYRLPADSVKRQQWLLRMNRDLRQFTPTPYTRICSEHFRDDDFNEGDLRNYRGLTAVPPYLALPTRRCFIRLKKDAIPRLNVSGKLNRRTSVREISNTRSRLTVSQGTHQEYADALSNLNTKILLSIFQPVHNNAPYPLIQTLKRISQNWTAMSHAHAHVPGHPFRSTTNSTGDGGAGPNECRAELQFVSRGTQTEDQTRRNLEKELRPLLDHIILKVIDAIIHEVEATC